MKSSIAKVVRKELTDNSVVYVVVIYETNDYSIIARISCDCFDSAYKLEHHLNTGWDDGDFIEVAGC